MSSVHKLTLLLLSLQSVRKADIVKKIRHLLKVKKDYNNMITASILNTSTFFNSLLCLKRFKSFQKTKEKTGKIISLPGFP